jgi:hypothetical protein
MSFDVLKTMLCCVLFALRRTYRIHGVKFIISSFRSQRNGRRRCCRHEEKLTQPQRGQARVQGKQESLEAANSNCVKRAGQSLPKFWTHIREKTRRRRQARVRRPLTRPSAPTEAASASAIVASICSSIWRSCADSAAASASSMTPSP